MWRDLSDNSVTTLFLPVGEEQRGVRCRLCERSFCPVCGQNLIQWLKIRPWPHAPSAQKLLHERQLGRDYWTRAGVRGLVVEAVRAAGIVQGLQRGIGRNRFRDESVQSFGQADDLIGSARPTKIGGSLPAFSFHATG